MVQVTHPDDPAMIFATAERKAADSVFIGPASHPRCPFPAIAMMMAVTTAMMMMKMMMMMVEDCNDYRGDDM